MTESKSVALPLGDTPILKTENSFKKIKKDLGKGGFEPPTP
tara:strand:- start:3934 stop:4056 length:123 start_codon:yes stop_codon:yes gene_type:complete